MHIIIITSIDVEQQSFSAYRTLLQTVVLILPRLIWKILLLLIVFQITIKLYIFHHNQKKIVYNIVVY